MDRKRRTRNETPDRPRRRHPDHRRPNHSNQSHLAFSPRHPFTPSPLQNLASAAAPPTSQSPPHATATASPRPAPMESSRTNRKSPAPPPTTPVSPHQSPESSAPSDQPRRSPAWRFPSSRQSESRAAAIASNSPHLRSAP